MRTPSSRLNGQTIGRSGSDTTPPTGSVNHTHPYLNMPPLLTGQEIGKHNTRDSCWIIVHGNQQHLRLRCRSTQSGYQGMFTTSPNSWMVCGSSRPWSSSTASDLFCLSLSPTFLGGVALDHPGERKNDVAVMNTELMLAQAEAGSS